MLIPVSHFAAQSSNGLLDLVPGAAACWSMFLERAGYSGPCLRARENVTEQDIGFSGSQLDTASLLGLAGANSVYLTTWYDQSGSSHHGTQTTTANQFRLVNAGTLQTGNNSDPSAFGFNNNIGVNLTSPVSHPFFLAVVFRNWQQMGFADVADLYDDLGGTRVFNGTSPGQYTFEPNYPTVIGPATSWWCLTVQYNGGSTRAWVNNDSPTTINPGSSSARGLWLGGRPPLTGVFGRFEFALAAIWPGLLADEDAAAIRELLVERYAL